MLPNSSNLRLWLLATAALVITTARATVLDPPSFTFHIGVLAPGAAIFSAISTVVDHAALNVVAIVGAQVVFVFSAVLFHALGLVPANAIVVVLGVIALDAVASNIGVYDGDGKQGGQECRRLHLGSVTRVF